MNKTNPRYGIQNFYNIVRDNRAVRREKALS